MRKPKNPWLTGLLTLTTASLYAWFCLSQARQQLQQLKTINITFDIKRWPLRTCLVLLLLLVPADVALRNIFVTKPGFLQVEILGAIGIFWVLSSILAGRLQAKLNALPAISSPTATPTAGADPAPAQVASVTPTTQKAPTTLTPEPMITPQSITTTATDDWQQGIATLQPSMNALPTESESTVAMNDSVSTIQNKTPLASGMIVAPGSPSVTPDPQAVVQDTVAPAPPPQPETQEVVVPVPHNTIETPHPQIVTPTNPPDNTSPNGQPL